MTRTERLSIAIKAIYDAKKEEIKSLPTTGPRGGYNAKHIEGWVRSPHGSITKAANLAGAQVMKFWAGHRPTPCGAIPACVEDECITAYFEIFQ